MGKILKEKNKSRKYGLYKNDNSKLHKDMELIGTYDSIKNVPNIPKTICIPLDV